MLTLPPTSTVNLFFRACRLPSATTAALAGVLCPEIGASRALWHQLAGNDLGPPAPLAPLPVFIADRLLVRFRRLWLFFLRTAAVADRTRTATDTHGHAAAVDISAVAAARAARTRAVAAA
jgi:hypothetical protein